MNFLKVRTLFNVLFIALTVIILDATWKHDLETYARQQAREELQNVKVCLDNNVHGNVVDKVFSCTESIKNAEGLEIFAYDVTRKNFLCGLQRTYRYTDKNNTLCAGGTLTTTPKGVFAYDINSDYFLCDPSLDCTIVGDRQMLTEEDCQLQREPLLCIAAISALDKSLASGEKHYVNWWFEGKPEFLEWIVYPSFDEKQSDGQRQVLIAIAIKSDGLYSNFQTTSLLLKFLAFFGILFALCFEAYARRKHAWSTC